MTHIPAHVTDPEIKIDDEPDSKVVANKDALLAEAGVSAAGLSRQELKDVLIQARCDKEAQEQAERDALWDEVINLNA